MNANGSCNCNSPKAIVMSEGWKQKERFVQEVQKALCEMQVTPPLTKMPTIGNPIVEATTPVVTAPMIAAPAKTSMLLYLIYF